MKKILLLACFTLSCCIAFAVDRYEGWYITPSKDTVHGHILADDLNFLSFMVTFEAADGTTTIFKPGQVKRFGLNVLETWKVYTVLNLGEPVGLKDSSTLIFAQVLNEEGKMKYYRYQYYFTKPGRYNNDMYVQGERSLVTEHCLMKGKGEVLRFQLNTVFAPTKKQLRSFMDDCEAAVTSINQVKNIAEQLPSIVKQYNRCKGKK